MFKSMFFTLMLTVSLVAIAVPAQSQSVNSTLKWSPIDKAPKELLNAVKKEDPTARFSLLSQVGQKMPLVLVDLTPNECGATACTVRGYAKRGASYIKVLDLLTDEFPENDNFVALTKQNEMPCLDFKTASKRVESVRARWCYDGERYNFEQAVLPDKR